VTPWTNFKRMGSGVNVVRLFIPAHTVHQEINATADSPTVWAVTRSGTDPIVVNLAELDKFAEPAAREYRHA